MSLISCARNLKVGMNKIEKIFWSLQANEIGFLLMIKTCHKYGTLICNQVNISS